MPTVTRNTYGDRNISGQAPYGNAVSFHFKLTTNATGAVIDSDSAAAVADADVVNVGILPAGMRLDDGIINVVTAMSATVDGIVGFAYVDGVDVAAAPEDADYFGTGLEFASAGVLRKATALAPVTLAKNAYLTLTLDTADNAKVSEIHFIINGVIDGPV